MALGLTCLVLSICIVLVSSPQVIVLMLVWQTFAISLLLGLMNNVWYAYILFLVFLGGMLVVFIYIRRLASRIKVDPQYINFLKTGLIALVSIFIMLWRYSGWPLLSTNHLFYREYKIVYIFALDSVYLLYLFVVRYLLLTLWVVCVLVKISKGPIRKLI